MRKLVFLAALFGAIAAAQQTIPLTNRPPDCYFQFGPLTNTAIGFSYDNRISGCTDWALTYNSQGFAGLSIVLQSAPAATGGVPGTWVTLLGTITTGINPNTAITKGETRWSAAYNPWVRVNLTSVVGGPGSIYGEVHGWRAPIVLPASTGGCPVGTPCVVIGPNADGLASTFPSVQVAGQESGTALVRPLRTDNVGILASVRTTAGVDGQSNAFGGLNINGGGGVAFNQVWPYVFNGTTWDRVRGTASTDNTAQIANTGMSRVQLAIASAAGQTRNAIGVSQVADANGGDNLIAGGLSFFNGATWDRARGNTTGLFVQGAAVDGAALAGQPLRTGGADVITPGGGAGVNIKTLGLNAFGGIVAAAVGAAASDGLSNTLVQYRVIDNGGTINAPTSKEASHIFNGVTWDRMRSAALANSFPATTTTARNSIGAAQIEKGSRFSVISNPAANSQATASIAAEASVRHVVDCVSFAASSGAAVTATNLTLNIRDGATGAGTIIWTYQLSAPTAAALGVQLVVPHSLCGLALFGTTNTAMTAEFSAGVTGVVQSVSFSGYNVN